MSARDIASGRSLFEELLGRRFRQTFPPPFEEKLVGLKRGESAHIPVPYPDTHHSPEVAGKTVTFRVEIKEIGRKELPAIDDDFAPWVTVPYRMTYRGTVADGELKLTRQDDRGNPPEEIAARRGGS